MTFSRVAALTSPDKPTYLRASGESAVKDAYLKDAVNAVASGKAVPVSETKSMGCGIKFRERKTS